MNSSNTNFPTNDDDAHAQAFRPRTASRRFQNNSQRNEYQENQQWTMVHEVQNLQNCYTRHEASILLGFKARLSQLRSLQSAGCIFQKPSLIEIELKSKPSPKTKQKRKTKGPRIGATGAPSLGTSHTAENLGPKICSCAP